jgi:nucleotide-binding universal stress UspA family protein
MTIAVAHHASTISEHVLAEALREAAFRKTDLVVVNVSDSLDLDKGEALTTGIGDVLDKADKDGSVNWRIELAAGTSDIAKAILDKVDEVGAELLVIGARHRSPVGKAFLGSLSQVLILESPVPVLVVKKP